MRGRASRPSYGGGVADQVRVEVRRAGDRFVTAVDGLSTRHSFSFGAHYDPDDVGFAAMTAHNEELIQVARGYDDHPHRNAEIVTWVLSGSLVHTDSAGNRGLVVPGLVQRMSAGSGIVHAERNDGFRLDPDRPAVPVHFVQTWLIPDTPGGAPGYGQAELEPDALAADWVPAVSGGHRDRAVGLGTASATLWLTTASTGQRRRLPEATRSHLFVARGEIELEKVGVLGPGDAARVTGRAALAVRARSAAELLLWSFD